MKRLIIGLLLCFVMGLHQVAWADTTNSGATTNTQTNTSGSNTTISGGYSQESTTTYQSGSSSHLRLTIPQTHIQAILELPHQLQLLQCQQCRKTFVLSAYQVVYQHLV